MHIGADEVNFSCWNASKRVADYMDAHGLARSALGSPSASGRGRGPRTAVPPAGSNTVAGSGPQRAGRTCAAAGRAAEPPPAARVRGAAAGGFAICGGSWVWSAEMAN